MSKIIKLEDGQLVAEDPDNGERVPVSFEALEAEKAGISEGLLIDRTEFNPWSTRSFESTSAMSLRPHPGADNPVLTRHDVTDLDADYVADPFVVEDAGVYYMFFEAKESSSPDSVIGYATSLDGVTWDYQEIALSESFHLAYPLVFCWDGKWYMIPDNGERELRIYEATDFPTGWQHADTALETETPVSDPVPIYWDGRWYVINYNPDVPQKELFYAGQGDEIVGREWSEHPESPIVTGGDTDPLRNAGRAIVRADYIDQPYQLQNQEQVEVYRISKLTPTEFEQTGHSTNPVLSRTGFGWNADDMHHMDAILPFAGANNTVVVDGRQGNRWSIGVYTFSGEPSVLAHLYNGNKQTVTGSSTWTQLELTNARPDVKFTFDGDADKWVVPETGWYDVSASVHFESVPEAEENELRIRIYNDSTNTELNFASNSIPSGVEQGTVTAAPVARLLDRGDEIIVEMNPIGADSFETSDGTGRSYLKANKVW